MNLPVHFDSDEGELAIGSQRFTSSAAGTRGEVRLGGDSGTVLRPLRFGERTAIISRAAAEHSPLEAAASGILLTCAVENLSALDPLVLEIAALVLAGAQEEAPAFNEARRIAQLRTGLDAGEIERLHARDVDRMANASDALDPAPGWNRIVFAPQRELTLEEIRNELAGRLIVRGAGVTSVKEPDLEAREPDVPVEERIRRSVVPQKDQTIHFGRRHPNGSRTIGSFAREPNSIPLWSAVETRGPNADWMDVPPMALLESDDEVPAAAEGAGYTPNRLAGSPVIAGRRAPDWPLNAQRHPSPTRELTNPEWQNISGTVPVTAELAPDVHAWRPVGRLQSSHARVEWSVLPLSGVVRGAVGATIQHATLPEDIADALALLLNEEADLRGID